MPKDVIEKPRRQKNRKVLSLFTGAGGLDIGLEEAGFKVALCVEIDKAARFTIEHNRRRWRIATPFDINLLAPESALKQAKLQQGELDLLAGGPPCQPFSKSGYWAKGDSGRLNDPRAVTLSCYLSILEKALPEVVLLENVKGLIFRDKDEGFQLLIRGIDKINRNHGTSYHPQLIHINAADFGVPQIRERVFVVAHRQGKSFVPPTPTHHQPGNLDVTTLEHYRTAWDAIGDLDLPEWPEELNPKGKWAALIPSIPEGANYLWHTPKGGGLPLFGWRTRYWSFLLKLSKKLPSWTIQAQPGPATGPFHWRGRRLSLRELCRLQTFPDDYEISGSYIEAHEQIGNAVPPAIGELMGLEIRRQYFGEKPRKNLRLACSKREGCPDEETLKYVPQEYLALAADHPAHPGTGRGPKYAQSLQL
jgi:DNA (cytosine-5)-methyltransferase 1